jgi:hypothetical protein
MTPARWLIAGSWLLLFWLLAVTVLAPGIQRSLKEQASLLLPAEGSDYPALEVVIDGQRAILRGRVRRPEERLDAETRVREQVRRSGIGDFGLAARFNPITHVSNEIEVVPFPPGWLLLAGHGDYAELRGAAATEFEARDAAERIRARWAERGGRVERKVGVDANRYDEALDGERTLGAAIPVPKIGDGGDSAQIQIARLGGEWRRLPIEAADTLLLSEVLAMGLSEKDWQEEILPAVDRARRYQMLARARETRRQEQAQMPPPHVFLAARDQRLLLVGEVATLGLKRELLNSLIATFPKWRIIDDVRVSQRRRELGDFGPITTALLPKAENGGKSLMLGLSGQGWQAVDWKVGREARPWAELLPKDLPPDLMARDAIVATEWLQGEAKGIPTLPQRAQPSFLTLALLPDRVLLAGQLAEEGLRSQLEDATRKAYGDKVEVMTEALLARGTCEPSGSVEQTVRSLPPLPKAGEQPILAFALPGQVWKTAAVEPAVLEPGGVARTDILPPAFPAAMAEDAFGEAFDYVRDLWQKPPATTASTPPKK